uniref:9-cis-epoxy-carotenoid dioxygenase n=1 Tax=Pohlia nutans TaxID=140635 RepID=A0A4P8JH38_9BRYO|nr:9-cis-epoxy-carotenoid dioxygenase [Pohlia nutans]
MALATLSWAKGYGRTTTTRCSSQSDPPGAAKKRDRAVIQKAVLGEQAVIQRVAVEALPAEVQRQVGESPSATSRVQELVSAALSVAERFIPLIEPRERTSRTDPRVQLQGNFAPVEESPPRAAVVTGTLPACLNGAYVRNGGNPQFAPAAGYHYFDGDGMLHVVRIKDGAATHSCRFTRTNRYVHEKRAGRPVFTKALGELHGLGGLARVALFNLRGWAGTVDLAQGMGAANAGLEFFNGMLLAMSEDDMPYAVRVTDDGDVETSGRYNFEGALKRAMTAHPKIDPRTGEMHAFSCDWQKEPFLTYFRVTADGTKGAEVPITLREPNLMHDFAITENYAIFPETQMVFRLQELFNGKSPILIDLKKVPRFGVLPRNAQSEARMRWFELPDVMCFHYVNAWEEGEDIVLVGSINTPPPFIFDQPEDLQNRLCLFRLNMRTGLASKHQLSHENIDIGRCNNLYTGRKTRYAYMSISGPWPRFSGIAKVDLDSGRIAGWRKCAPGCFVSEPYFVPASETKEDDGYVVTYYQDENTGVSELLVMDAQSPTLEIVASIHLPSRVPYGFHGTFLSEDQLASQRSSLP